MTTITVNEKVPCVLDGRKVVSFETAPMNFAPYARMSVECWRRAGSKESTYQRLLLRDKLKAQVTAKEAGGTTFKLSDVQISQLPIPYALKLRDALEGSAIDNLLVDGKLAVPEILADGDGTATPIHIKLARPLMFGGGKSVTELEFLATSFAAIEEAVAEGAPLLQTIALLKMAKPYGDGITLSTLPDAAVDQVSMADGAFILDKVSSRFFVIADD